MKSFKLLSILHYILAGFYSLYVLMFIRGIFLGISMIMNEGFDSVYIQTQNYKTSVCQSNAADSFLSTEVGCNIFFVTIVLFGVLVFGLLFICNLMAGLSYQRKK